MRYPKFNSRYALCLFLFFISCNKKDKLEEEETTSGIINWLLENLFNYDTLSFFLIIAGLIVLTYLLFSITISLKYIQERLNALKNDLVRRETKGSNHYMKLDMNESNFNKLFEILNKIEQTQESVERRLDHFYNTKLSDQISMRKSTGFIDTHENNLTLDSNKHTQEYYFSTPESNGVFKTSFQRDPHTENFHYKITTENNMQTAKIEFVSGKDDIAAINQKENRLKPVCNIKTDNLGPGQKVQPEKSGTVRKIDDGWIIEEKMTVRIV